MLVEALVLDRDHGLLDRRRDLVGLDEDPLLVPGQGRERSPVAGEDDRVLRRVVLRPRLEVGQVLRHGHHHAEDPGDDREQPEPEEHEEGAELLDPGAGLPVGRRAAPAVAAAKPRDALAQPLALGMALGLPLGALALPIVGPLPGLLLGLLDRVAPLGGLGPGLLVAIGLGGLGIRPRRRLGNGGVADPGSRLLAGAVRGRPVAGSLGPVGRVA